jgi:hypothetical protein
VATAERSDAVAVAAAAAAALAAASFLTYRAASLGPTVPTSASGVRPIAFW